MNGWYNEQVQELYERVVYGFPALFVLVYFVHRDANQKWMQNVLFGLSMLLGLQTLFIMSPHKQNSYQALQSATGLATLWALCLIELDLLKASGSMLLSFAVFIVGTVLLNYRQVLNQILKY